MRQQARPSVIQAMVCGLFGAKQLFETVLAYLWFDLGNEIR